MRISFLFVVMFLFSTASIADQSSASETQVANNESSSIKGRWEGSLDHDGTDIEFAIGFRKKNGLLEGKMDIVGMKGISLESLIFDAPMMTFEFDSPVGLAKFSAKISGNEIDGNVEWPDVKGTFTLTRQASADPGGFISEYMNEHHIAGLAAAVVRQGEVVWTGTYGFANVANNTPVTPETIFLLASVTKTITGTALMKLHLEGKFGLDDDVNEYLPFKLQHPGFPDTRITFAQLLQHRSGIKDDPKFYGPLWSTADGDPTSILGEYLEGYLGQEGEQYNAERNFYPYKPGSEFNYCNTCYALLGYLAERISGLPYPQYTQDALFKPLGMNDAAWSYADVNQELTASPYQFDPEKGFVDGGIVGYPDWPAGLLRVSVNSLARFLAAYTNKGMLEGSQVMDSALAEKMSPGHLAVGYYTWFASSLEDTADVLYSHGGSDLGTRTLIAFNPATRDGFIILTNSESDIQPVAAEIYKSIALLGWD